MNEKRMSAIAACLSRPRSCSIWVMICSIISSSFPVRFSILMISSSPSTILLAAKRTGMSASFAWSSIRCMMPWRQRCTAPPYSSAGQKSCRAGASWYFAMCTACSTSSSTPSFFAAEIGTTGMPSNSSILFTRIAPPFPRSSSIILSASTIGTPNSISCMVR